MSAANDKSKGSRLPIMQGLLPIKGSQVPVEIIAGLTLAVSTATEVIDHD